MPIPTFYQYYHSLVSFNSSCVLTSGSNHFHFAFSTTNNNNRSTTKPINFSSSSLSTHCYPPRPDPSSSPCTLLHDPIPLYASLSITSLLAISIMLLLRGILGKLFFFLSFFFFVFRPFFWKRLVLLFLFLSCLISGFWWLEIFTIVPKWIVVLTLWLFLIIHDFNWACDELVYVKKKKN